MGAHRPTVVRIADGGRGLVAPPLVVREVGTARPLELPLGLATHV